MNLFGFGEYKAVIRQKIEDHRSERGYRTRLAKAAGCQMSYLSQVLHGSVQLTPDHALGLSQFWSLSGHERDYFLELVNLERAGTRALRTLISERLEELKSRAENLAERYDKPRIAEGTRETQYYSSWHYSAIHILVTIASFRSVRAIAQKLFLPEVLVQEALVALEAMGLVRLTENRWVPTQAEIHLPKESLLNSINHGNWRQRAVLKSQLGGTGNLHYTAVHSLSRNDYQAIKDHMLHFIDQSRKTVTTSKEEELAVMNCDFFMM